MAATIPDIRVNAGHTPAGLRHFLASRFDEGGREEFFGDADRILEIDRDYIGVEFDGGLRKVSELTAAIAPLRDMPPTAWRDGELDLVCALAALGRAWVRLEYVDMVATMDAVVRYLDDTITQYCQALGRSSAALADCLDLHWWDKASLVRSLRRQVDGDYRRVAQIDGENWHRRELLLAREALDPTDAQLAFVREFVRAKLPDLPAPVGAFDDYLRAASAALVASEGTPIRLILALMQAASEDPAVDADHTTLLCPRGNKLETPWDLGKDDFLCWVVFAEGFVPPRNEGVGDYLLIQKAVYAHHSTKKARMAKKYRAMYSPDSPASIADDLGDLGIYFNEGAHHKGHVVAGVFSAMRYLMPIQVVRGGQVLPVQGLTDFRLTRASNLDSRRFEVAQFPSCYHYGNAVRNVLEVAFEHGVVLPPMNTSWR